MSNSVDLEAYDEMFNDAEVSEFKEVPDGTYQVFIDEIAMKETKAEPVRPMLSWVFKIMSGPCEGRLLFKNAVVSIASKEDTNRSLSFIKTDLSICGVELKKFSKIHTKLKGLRNTHLEVKVSTKKREGKDDIQNIWIQRLLEEGEVDDGDSTPF
jgi:hypothetical protein